ncbi:CDP-diacylglycerol/serine O-phosphatidyltransferase [Candidatus Amoebophilus asiaticus 5a2]|uniref:CDP-diacylglycerol--serine O-phosphatidyltransferase n=1 Tax=Amoebophilus asiaticus (strain 5a2) TaxID=452471 RepID=B3EUC0_AMOA5|nr:CDP-diacylglycerol--serine O-phosphatidyltransferase [Candidatus Amoebophilus asiaticus]ACE05539.1 CDP-diacylglycerol/serine O-phosphatidyltransferase [Candidatus Amoebophilus asiaticus 5a2]
MKKHLPNFLTLLNLASGSIGVILALKGNLIYAALLIRIGACFDFLDGFVARALRVHSSLGKQLDSLADLITFGFLPTVIMFSLLELQSSSPFLPYIAILITLCAALRLAKFNIDIAQKDVFLGLSTTAYGIFISTLPNVITRNNYPAISHILAHPYTLATLSILGSLLLVSNIPFIAFKFSGYSWRANRIKYIFILTAAFLIGGWRIEGVALSMLLYIVFGSTLQKYSKQKRS